MVYQSKEDIRAKAMQYFILLCVHTFTQGDIKVDVKLNPIIA